MTSSWLTELGPYIPRFGALPVQIDEALTVHASLGVTAPMAPTDSVKAHLFTQLSLFNIGSLRVASGLATAAELLFRDGRITPTCLQVRLLFEYWGATTFAGILGERVRDADLEKAEDLENVVIPINRLIGGSRSPVMLPRGGEAKANAFSVMKFIQQLEKSEPGLEQTYAFLCETCHPSFIQQSYLWMAGGEGDNWRNEKFRTHAHTLLEQLTAAGESATIGFARTSEHFVKVASPFIPTSE